MSKVLSRLVARAKGTQTSRVAPRLPGRFEAEAGSGDLVPEVTMKSVDATVPRQASPVSPSNNDTRTAHKQDAQAEQKPNPRPPQPVEQGKKRASSHKPRMDEPTSTKQVAAPPSPLLPASAAPDPRPVAPRVENKPDTTSTPVAHNSATSASHASPIPQLTTPPPPPLIAPPHDAPDLAALAAFLEGEDSREPAPAQASDPALASATPTEVVVHIGQIDIRSDRTTPQPRPVAQRPKPQMSDLSDYLRAKEPRR